MCDECSWLREDMLEIPLFSGSHFSTSVVLPRNFTSANIHVFGMSPFCNISLWQQINNLYFECI